MPCHAPVRMKPCVGQRVKVPRYWVFPSLSSNLKHHKEGKFSDGAKPSPLKTTHPPSHLCAQHHQSHQKTTTRIQVPRPGPCLGHVCLLPPPGGCQQRWLEPWQRRGRSRVTPEHAMLLFRPTTAARCLCTSALGCTRWWGAGPPNPARQQRPPGFSSDRNTQVLQARGHHLAALCGRRFSYQPSSTQM